jgi:hypothetical protein
VCAGSFPTINKSSAREHCGLRNFRADQFDAAVWAWAKSLLIDREALAKGLEAYQSVRAQEQEPIRERMKIVDTLLTDNRAQLDRLLELYLAGDFSKEALMERKRRIETTITTLQKERAGLIAGLEAQSLTPDQIQTIQDYTAEVGDGLKIAEDDFATRRRVMEALDVSATLAVENDERVVYAQCLAMPVNDGLSLVSNGSSALSSTN